MRRKLVAAAATVLVAAAGFSVPLLFTGGGSAQPAPRITICHRTGSQTNPTVTITISESAWPAHEAHGDTRGPCPPSTTTTTTTTTTPTPPSGIPSVIGTAGLSCRPADDQGPFLRLNVVAAGATATTIGMEKDVLWCSGAATQTRDLETFIEIVQEATAAGLEDVAVRVHTALCVKDFSVGRVQCVRREVEVGGTLTAPLNGCKTAKVQPGDPVSMLSKGVGNWFKTTKLEKEIVTCGDGTVGDLYLFTDVLSANPPTAAASKTSFRGIVCWWDPADGVPPQKCNIVRAT